MVDGYDQLLRRQPKLARGGIQDAHVGLVRNQPVDVGELHAGRGDGLARRLLQHLHPYFAGLRSARAKKDGLDEGRIAAGSGKFESDPRFTPAEKWALRYAREMYLNPERIDAAFYAEGKRHYTEAQIMELGAFIAFHYGMQAFARTLGARPLAQSSPATTARRGAEKEPR